MKDYEKVLKQITNEDLEIIKMALLEASNSSNVSSINKLFLELHNKLFKDWKWFRMQDLLDFDEVKKTVSDIYTKYGHIDILVNNAGVSDSKKIDDTSSEDFSKVVDINLVAMFNVIKAVSPYMKEQNDGVILNTSSMVSIYGQKSGVAYPASKFAVNGLTKSLALELAPFKTDMLCNVSDDVLKPLISSIPLGRIGLPSDIANAFLFLASDMASYITGVILSVDGAAKN